MGQILSVLCPSCHYLLNGPGKPDDCHGASSLSILIHRPPVHPERVLRWAFGGPLCRVPAALSNSVAREPLLPLQSKQTSLGRR